MLRNGSSPLPSGPLISNSLQLPGLTPAAFHAPMARLSRSAPGQQLFQILNRLRIPKSPRQKAEPFPTSGYPATGKWSVQLGERSVAGGLGGHSFLNLVNPQGEVVFQIHGYQVDRKTGEIDRGGFNKPLQLMPFAYLGNSVTENGTVLHPPIAITDQRKVPEMLDRVMRASDRIYERNVEYYAVTLRGEAQNSNSVTNTLGRIMAEYAPGLSNDNSITYFNTPGDDRDLLSGPLLMPRQPREIIPKDQITEPRLTHREFGNWRANFGRLRRVAEFRHRYPPGVDPNRPETYDAPRRGGRPGNLSDSRMAQIPERDVPPSSGPAPGRNRA